LTGLGAAFVEPREDCIRNPYHKRILPTQVRLLWHPRLQDRPQRSRRL
jgi:hypothetical protein